MKQRRIIIAALLIILCSSAPYIYLSHASQAPVVSFNPSSITGISVGNTFTITLQINGVTNLWGWTLGLQWDPSILQMQGTPKEDPFLKTAGSTVFVPVAPNNTLGVLASLSCLILSNNGATGSGNLTDITFSVAKAGTCQINITDSEFDNIDSSGNSAKIPVTISNATFTNIVVTTPSPNPSAHGPKAIFTPADGSYLKLGSTIKLDASSSQPGFDTVNGSTTCPITNYVWRVEFQNGTTFLSLNGITPQFNTSIIGPFRIILIVTATDPNPPSDPNFNPTDSATASIDVYSNPQDTQIDVLTDNGGVGLGANSSQYGPLQTVQIYASVKNQNILLPNQNVIFTVQNANGSNYVVREGITNQSGVATTQFRLPSPDPNSPSTRFGIWSITASTNSTSGTVNDTTFFNFNYLSAIYGVQIPDSVHRQGTLPIVLAVNNANCPTPWSDLTITVFDQAGIPIGSSAISATKQLENITVIDSALTIPSWAFTGQATAYLCVLANSSNTQEAPLAPETVATFQILP